MTATATLRMKIRMKNPDDHSAGALCGLCSTLFSRRSNLRPDNPAANNSGVEMAEVREQTEDEPTPATSTSTRPANARESTEGERINHRSTHDTAIEVERLRIEAQEKEAAAARAHELLMLERQIELARIHAAAPGPIDPRTGYMQSLRIS